MLIFPLKKEWYEKIKSGVKTIEYREVKRYWTRRFERAEFGGGGMHWDFERKRYVFDNFSAPCFFRLGYTKETLEAWITKIEIVDGKDTDLHIDKPVYAIHFYLQNNVIRRNEYMNDDLRKLATAVCNETGLGVSSKTIVAYCTGAECFHAGRPYDADDVSRCINVLSFFPEWKEKIKHISDRFPCWGSIGKNWQVIEDYYNEQDWHMVNELLDLFSKC